MNDWWIDLSSLTSMMIGYDGFDITVSMTLQLDSIIILSSWFIDLPLLRKWSLMDYSYSSCSSLLLNSIMMNRLI